MDLTTGPSQAAKVAAAVVNPTYFKKSRRVVEDDSKVSLSPRNSSVGISVTNSFCWSALTISLSWLSSSTLFQYFLFDAILFVYDFWMHGLRILWYLLLIILLL